MPPEKLIPIAGGAASAALTLSVLSGFGGTVVLAYLALLPLFVVAFGWGIRAGQVAALIGTALTFAFGGLTVGLIYAGTTAVPAWLVNRQALLGRKLPDGSANWYPVGHILCQLTALGAIVTAAAAVVHIDVPGGFQAAVAGYVDRILSAHFALPPADRQVVAARLVPVLPGATVMSWIVMITINAALAQALVVRTGKNRRPTPAYGSLDLPEWISWVLVAAAAVTLFAGGTLEYVGRNLTMILAMPFFLSGLGFIHVLARQLAAPGLALTIVYTIVVFSGWAVLAVAGLGMIERWADLRTRLAARLGPSNEEED